MAEAEDVPPAVPRELACDEAEAAATEEPDA
jgi:hypothetical protein